MCGIIGIVSNSFSTLNLIDSLKKLEYRGYDSSGVCYKYFNDIEVIKSLGYVDKLKEKISNKNIKTAIAHTRWATHGNVSICNTHPLISSKKKFYLVHNGIILNYKEIKNYLLTKGYSFSSSTDSEVICNYLEYLYLENQSILESLKILSSSLEGEYAICVLTSCDDNIYFLKNKSPLILAKNKDGYALSSDQSALENFDYLYDLKDLEYGYISLNGVFIMQNELRKEIVYYKNEVFKENKENIYSSYFEKEISEILLKSKYLVTSYLKNGELNLDSSLKKYLSSSKRIVLVGCGTSYNACLAFKSLSKRKIDKEIEIYLGSEFNEEYNYKENDALIFLSQSGETLDLISCLEFIKLLKIESLSITNNKNSTLAKNTSYSLSLNIGKEVSVASTKAYFGEVLLLLIIFSVYKDELFMVEDKLNHINLNKNKIIEKGKYISQFKNVYFLGRGQDYDFSLECSLKLKEVTYIHSEAVHIGELKHGPLSLVDTSFLCIVLSSLNEYKKKNEISIEEIKGRKGNVIDLSDYIDSSYALNGLLLVYISYLMTLGCAKNMNIDIDRPRNLAKSVTVR